MNFYLCVRFYIFIFQYMGVYEYVYKSYIGTNKDSDRSVFRGKLNSTELIRKFRKQQQNKLRSSTKNKALLWETQK